MDSPDVPNGEKFVDNPDDESPSPSKSNPPGAGGAASKMPRSCIAAPPSKVMNVEAGFGAVFSETGGGGGFDAFFAALASFVRNIAALRRSMASTFAWRATKAALRASAFTASSLALQASKSFRDSAAASDSPRASKHLAHRSWAF